MGIPTAIAVSATRKRQETSMRRVQDKVAIVTGGASGLGSAIARRLVTEGARVVITDIQTQFGQGLANELNCDFIAQDVTNEKQWESVIHQVEEKYAALHILVNSAGIEGSANTNPETATLSDWQTIQRVNVEGVFLGCRTAIPALRLTGGGSIINLSSMGSLVPTPNNMAYGVSKAAVRHLTTSVAMHCAKNGSRIRCNSVHPGVIKTPMIERLTEGRAKSSGVAYEQLMKEYQSNIPQGEFQTPEDIAYAVLFLASDEAKHITGTQLIVDGGITMGR